jgi:hypothetical protein
MGLLGFTNPICTVSNADITRPFILYLFDRLYFMTAVAILFGFFNIEHYNSLWMGIAGGGSLIDGGLWLRKV